METINLSGINGVKNNVHVLFRCAIEEIIERAVASPELKDMDSNTIAELIHYAVLGFDIEFLQIRDYIEASRELASK